MQVDSPIQDIPLEFVRPHYRFLKKMYMSYEKIQFQQGFSYLKYAGFFVAASFVLMIIANKGIFPNYLVGITFIGFSVLVVSAMRMLSTANVDIELACYAGEGKKVEEKYASLLESHYFQTVDLMKIFRYRLVAALRLVPFIFVGISTICTGIALAMKTSMDMAMLVGFIAVAVLCVSLGFLLRLMKKCLLPLEQGK